MSYASRAVTVALWSVPADVLVRPVTLRWVALPAVPVALKLTGEPVSEPLVAVRVLEPAVVPRVQLPTVAMPEVSVVAEPPVREPPPEPIAKVTLTLATTLPYWSLTMTLGRSPLPCRPWPTRCCRR